MQALSAQQHFESALQCFTAAAAHAGLIERYFRIAGHILCCRFAGEALVSINTDALEHLAVAPCTPEFTVNIFDSDSTGVRLQSPYAKLPMLKRGEIPSLTTLDIDTIYNHHTHSLDILNYQAKQAISWSPSASKLPWWVMGSPLQRTINCWMMRYGVQLTHAGAIATDHGAILLTGKGGSGKSTTTLACMEAGFSYISEDYCLVEADPKPMVHSVYNSAKLERATLIRFPHLINLTANPARKPDEKAFIFLNRYYADRFRLQAPLRAIACLTVGNFLETTITKASIVDGLMALCPSTFFQLSSCQQQTLATYKTILEKIPCYKITLGLNDHTIPQKIQQLLAMEAA